MKLILVLRILIEKPGQPHYSYRTCLDLPLL